MSIRLTQIYHQAGKPQTTDASLFQYRRWWLALWLLTLWTATVHAQVEKQFTNSHPLIIVGESDVPPYEYIDNNGNPTGHNVELLDFILNQLDIPHEFRLSEWNKATEVFENRKADLIIVPSGVYNSAPYFNSRNNLSYYRFMVATKAGGTSATTLEELKDVEGIVVRSNDKTIPELLHQENANLRVHYASTKDALIGIYTGRYEYFIWAEEPLKWKIRELSLSTDISLSEINIPAREGTFAGYNQKLIDLIDDQFARMEQHGELGPIHDKWLHPDREHNNTPMAVLIITLIILIIAFILFFTNRLIHRQLTNAQSKVEFGEVMMREALSMTGYSVLTYSVKKRMLVNRHGHLLPKKGITREELYNRLLPTEKEETEQEFMKLVKGEQDVWTINRHWNTGTPEEPHWIFVSGHAIVERDSNKRPRYIIAVLKDVSAEREEEQRNEELATKYLKMFDSTLTSMSFYDQNGRLLGLNQNMRALCEFDTLGEKHFRETSLFDLPHLKGDFSPTTREVVHTCQRMQFPSLGIDKYIEFRIRPTFANGELQYYIVTARDVSAERLMYLEQQRQNKELGQAIEQINLFEDRLKQLLQNSNMWVWRSSLKDKTIALSQSLQKDEYVVSFDEYLKCIDEQYLQTALEHYGHMTGSAGTIDVILLFKHTPPNPEPHWLASNGMPIRDADGNITGHFGIVRDVSELMEAQMSLKRETARAEDSGKLKSMFLANMTHEIRTPLNAIVGFSDLLQMIDTPDERKEFIRIIRNNCDMLIRLINDIIEASTLNQGPLSIEPADIDFAQAFDDICQTLAQRVQEPGVEFIVDNPYKSFLTSLDKGRMQQVITNFTTNAVKYTHQGHIKVGYRYISFEELKQTVDDPKIQEQAMPFSGIYMYCEDTGAGIPKDKQSAVFERFVKLNDFVQGTGLGLSICQSIADRCCGRIGVFSEGEGHGSTFWIWIPCHPLS